MSVSYFALDRSSASPRVPPLPDTMDEIANISKDALDVPCTIEAIGSTVRGIRAIISRLRKPPNLQTLYAKFSNVPPEVANVKFSKGCRQLYDHTSRYLVVTLPGKPHEGAASLFSIKLTSAATTANVLSELIPAGMSRCIGNSCSKEADASWGPNLPPQGRDDTWPSVVLEVGVSETKNKLRADAAWWLANSEGQVNLVITIAINQAYPELTFETFALQRPVQQLRNARPRYQPITRDLIVVSRPPGTSRQSITCVPPGPLAISCNDLLCRPANPGESDPNISDEFLKDISELVWRYQGI